MIMNMEIKVVYSTYCKIITVAVILLFVGLIIWTDKDVDTSWILWGTLVGLIISGLFYAPLSIAISSDCLIIHRLLRNKIIPLRNILKAEYCIPSVNSAGGNIKMCGSGGFMGYWGYFRDNSIGTYFAYYGKRSQCVLIRLNSGKQYIVSCADPTLIVNSVNKYKGISNA